MIDPNTVIICLTFLALFAFHLLFMWKLFERFAPDSFPLARRRPKKAATAGADEIETDPGGESRSEKPIEEMSTEEIDAEIALIEGRTRKPKTEGVVARKRKLMFEKARRAQPQPQE